MRNRLSLIFIFLGVSFTLCLDRHPAFAIGSQIGLEFAIDAPWRIEPYSNGRGGVRYGPIPIVITFHDAIFDHDRNWTKDKVLDTIGLKNIHVGVLQSIEVSELGKSTSPGPRQRPSRKSKTFKPSQLTEIERKIGISKKNVEPPHEVCWPTKGMNCAKLLDITKSHEWHAMLWYTPQQSNLKPGDNLYLSVTVTTKYKDKGRNWTNDLLVHAGEAPLPRFSNNWLYGDLHYHSQGTDNDGESAYSYRNVVRALGALGMDFTFATDHASDSIQSDTNLNLKSFVNIPGADKVTISGQKEARDLNPVRFGVAKSLIYGQNGANELIANDVSTGGVASYHSHGVLPQIFMGEEVDVWPGMSGLEQKSGNILFGDGLKYPWPHGRDPEDKNSCLNKAKNSKDRDKCRTKYSKLASANPRDHRTNKPFLVLDEQGASLREEFDDFVGDKIATLRFGNLFTDMSPQPSRQHMVYFPFDTTPGNATGFVSSQSTKFGGGSKKVEDLVQDIARKGRAFLAHPLASQKPGGAGPDMVPYSESSLDTAWRSPAILGLQFWNENARLLSIGPEGKSRTIYLGVGKLKKKVAGGNVVPKPIQEITVKRSNGTSATSFYYRLPWKNFPFEWEERVDLLPIEKTQFFDLYHGAFTWDKYLRKGLDQQQMRVLGWLKGGPRKWYMAGGSDAHGDWNFRREGRFLPCAIDNLSSWCDYPVVDTAIGKPRNLVFVGPPTGAPALALRNVKRYKNRQVIDALAAGRFSVTDGPALRIAVDRNRNGKIDDSDFQMGDTFHFYPGEKVPLIVEWISTREFGPVEKIDVYVGNKQTTFTPPNHGVVPLGGVYGTLGATGKGYTKDPSRTPVLQVTRNTILKKGAETPFHGKAKIFIDPRDYRLQTPNEFFYLRAFAQTGLNGNCPRIQQISKKLDGTCISRLAYSNPVWGRYISQCRKDSQAIDKNGDGMPDTCEEKKIKLDPCPLDHIRDLSKGPQSQQGIRSRSVPSPTQEATSVDLDKAVHFIAIDGSDMVIEPGTYQLASADTWLKIIPSGGQPSDAVIIEAMAGTHEEEVDTSLAVASPGEDEDSYHLVLFLQDGKTLEAMGSYSGIRKRAVRSFRRSQMRTLFRAKKRRTTATFNIKQATPSTKKSIPLSQQVFTAQFSVFTGAKYSCQVVESVITKPSIGGSVGELKLN